MLEALLEVLRESLSNIHPALVACCACCPPVIGSAIAVLGAMRAGALEDEAMGRK
jgi:hypothetical protein